MELLLILKVLLIIGAIVTAYAILRNLDIIKIILVYFKDLLFKKQQTQTKKINEKFSNYFSIVFIYYFKFIFPYISLPEFKKNRYGGF